MAHSRSSHHLSIRSVTNDLAPCFRSAEEAVAAIGDDKPIELVYPDVLAGAARTFLAGFAGRVLYAVKSNPNPVVVTLLARSGIRYFDVASLAELELVQSLVPDATLYFMHPVKSRHAITTAWRRGVRHFSFDSAAELAKIKDCLGSQKDLTLHLRLALPKAAESGQAAVDLSGKFGAGQDDAVVLLQAARRVAGRIGVCFHVGSQNMAPQAWERAIAFTRQIVDEAGVTLDSIDVGGGFPVAYPGMSVQPTSDFLHVIDAALVEHGFSDCVRLCEPGRALVAEAGSILVKVELRKDDALYLNDGTFGALYDAGVLNWRYPVRRVRDAQASGEPQPMLAAFEFYGPTCDSADHMRGPFHLPADMDEGDWIEVGNLGAYGGAMRTRFNGYFSDETALVDPDGLHGAVSMPLRSGPATPASKQAFDRS